VGTDERVSMMDESGLSDTVISTPSPPICILLDADISPVSAQIAKRRMAEDGGAFIAIGFQRS